MSKRFADRKPFTVLYEDDHYIAFFKPAGLLAVPADEGSETAMDALVNKDFAARPDTSKGSEALKLHPCHRLDRDTSGAILFAKGHRAQELMMELFRQKLVKKKYIAFVHGRLPHPKGEIKIALKEDRNSKDPDKISVTRYEVKQQRHNFAVVEVFPLTGRTNQIRIHFKEIGHPLVGENKFIFRKDYSLKFKRTALHAWELYFKQPITGKDVSITAPLSLDMQHFLDKNRT
jgi:tRNA pseudouridine32 synthase/23S rRNA pseudouridine746 synthase/23S rRNA pseudouridine1911/1915/1917 synthase